MLTSAGAQGAEATVRESFRWEHLMEFPWHSPGSCLWGDAELTGDDLHRRSTLRLSPVGMRPRAHTEHPLPPALLPLLTEPDVAPAGKGERSGGSSSEFTHSALEGGFGAEVQ